MSISTTSITTTSQATPAAGAQPSSISASSSSDGDHPVDDENELETGLSTIKKEPDVAVNDVQKQQVKKRKEKDEDSEANQMLASNSIKCQAISDELLNSNKVKMVPSIVRLNPLDKVPPGGLKQPFIVTGHIVEHRPAPSREIKGTNNAPTVQRINNISISNNSSVSSVAKNNNSNNNLWKLSKFESPSNILSKVNNASSSSTASSSSSSASSAASVKKVPLSRPDLVASSISALHAGIHQNQARTRPLLMNHNQHLHTNHNQQISTSNQQLGAAATQATALSSQLILSSIITASSGFDAQQLANGGSLNGLQFCLSAAPQSSNVSSSKFATSLSSNGELINKSAVSGDTEEPSSSCSTPSATTARVTASNSSSSSSAKSKSSSRSSGSSESAQTPEKAAAAATASSSLSSSGSAQGNAAAARLIDLGKRLLEATKEGKVALVRELVVDSGAPFTSDWLDTTALHIAAQNGSLEIAQILIQGGINKDARTKLKRTALHLAAQSGSLEVTDLLIKHGSDVNSLDMLEMTPLHWAVERGHVCVVERLLVANADYNIKSKFKLSPVDIAKNSRFFEIVELFKNWTSGVKDEASLNVYRNLEATLNESQDFLDIDYHLALDSATNSQDVPILDTDEHSLDLVGFEWNKFDFTPDLFLANSSEDEQNVNHLMKIVEELQKENQQLRQKVEQLSTTDQ